MSKYFSQKHGGLVAYVPGEQPKDRGYVKLNTNESPFPPSPRVAEAVQSGAQTLNLYCDPENTRINAAIAKHYGFEKSWVITGNGSDEILNYAVCAFCDENTPLVFADVTYGFYPVFAKINAVPTKVIPLKEDFTIDVDAFCREQGTIVLANPNAPTGIYLPLYLVERIVKAHPNNVVIVDEAYVDFGGESALGIVNRYDNLLVVQTFSKSRSLAGGRLGFGIANEKLIADLNTVKYSLNPYNVNTLTQLAGVASIEDVEYLRNNLMEIVENREYTVKRLQALGFEVLPSMANFIFARKAGLDGAKWYERLKEKGVLVRHFTKERIKDFNRVTIGTKEQMDAFLKATEEIIGGLEQ